MKEPTPSRRDENEEDDMRSTANPEGGGLLTISEAARALNCKPSLIYRLTKQGRIPHVRLGRLLRFPPNVAEQMITPPGGDPGEQH